MLKSLDGYVITVECQECGNDYTSDLSGRTLEFLDEFKEYENLITKCECGEREAFNMNFPMDAFKDKPDITERERTQRKNIRALIKKIRADYK
ncbi:hypothetical protein [Thalassobacillus sp. CUG 92003]|uniref:hypothetical protein n=1 Tax=Thalassobacillus sp. CUG 92003 TaxID=2736641 RepID=UPI0015E67A83|nr:hypothetical protein [Thalassobacillus sp. CUG 92003]